MDGNNNGIFTNLVMGELVRSSRSLTIWIQGGQAPISIWPAIDIYLGTLTLGPTIMVGFHVSAAKKRIWVNVGTISRIDTDPLPACAADQQDAAAPVAAPAQVE
jgi:hypothetical protein